MAAAAIATESGELRIASVKRTMRWSSAGPLPVPDAHPVKRVSSRPDSQLQARGVCRRIGGKGLEAPKYRGSPDGPGAGLRREEFGAGRVSPCGFQACSV